MQRKQMEVGIYRIKLTVYRTGNVHISFVNRISGEEKILRVRNPLVVQKRASPVNYRV